VGSRGGASKDAVGVESHRGGSEKRKAAGARGRQLVLPRLPPPEGLHFLKSELLAKPVCIGYIGGILVMVGAFRRLRGLDDTLLRPVS
jgi:hypothetical protein